VGAADGGSTGALVASTQKPQLFPHFSRSDSHSFSFPTAAFSISVWQNDTSSTHTLGHPPQVFLHVVVANDEPKLAQAVAVSPPISAIMDSHVEDSRASLQSAKPLGSEKPRHRNRNTAALPMATTN